jgi:hypothetical protein
MSFNPFNRFLKIQDFVGIPIPLGSAWAHSLTFPCTLGNVNVTPKLHFQLALFHALAVVASPKFKLLQNVTYLAMLMTKVFNCANLASMVLGWP